jgi:hypothetical protein
MKERAEKINDLVDVMKDIMEQFQGGTFITVPVMLGPSCLYTDQLCNHGGTT